MRNQQANIKLFNNDIKKKIVLHQRNATIIEHNFLKFRQFFVFQVFPRIPLFSMND